MPDFEIATAETSEDLNMVSDLFGMFAEDMKRELDVELMEFGLGDEIASLPGPYAPPGGRLLLARDSSKPKLGCVGVKALDIEGACEIKRQFVARDARGRGVGAALMSGALSFARARQYKSVLLDTKVQLVAANALYRSFGFEQVPLYWDNPVPDTVAFRKAL